MKNGFSTIMVVFFLLQKGSNAAILEGPANTVASIKSTQVKLNCTADSPIGYWVLSKDGNTSGELSIIGPGCATINDPFGDHYTTELINGGRICNLIISNITMEQAGVYKCIQGTAYLAAILTVTDSSPVNTVNNTSDIGAVVENESVIIECTLNYNGSMPPAPTLRPYFYWTDFNGQNVISYYNSTTQETAISQLKVPAGRQDIMPYTCHVHLRLEPPTNFGYATNTPTVSSNASSRIIDVLYSAKITSITSSVSTVDNCVYQTENFTCTADADPPAQYEWLDLNNGTISNGSVKYFASGGLYQCRAYNHIGSNDTGIVNATSCNPAQNLTINGTNCADNFCTCNGNDSNSKQISIICMANGIPIPSVKWRSENQFYELYETIEVIYDGNYTCTASNTYGGKNYSEELTVFVSGCLDPSSIITTLSSLNVTTTTTKSKPPVGAIAGGIVAGVFVIANVVATCYFCWYYKKVEGASERKNKVRLDRRFTWLKKMMPCESDTQESTGRNCLWVSLFILLGIVTGIVTFPIWILLANNFEKNNETSALTRRENGEGNGRRPTNISSANHSQQPPTNQMNPIRQEGPYKNESSRENIELNNSLRSRNLLLPDFQPSRPPPAGRPPPPPNKPSMNSSTNRSKDYTVNDQQTQASNPEHTTYADLPFVPRNTLPTATPVQFLNVSNDTYASLNKT